ncbi:hypothetical protein KBZ21_37505, partial [Streptomyces sp. A73]|nr:hypothetical protein [Streptomyces sp. A73]
PEYVADVRRITAGVGAPDFVAPQDWMCEPWVIYGRNQHLETGNPARFHGTREARGLTDDEPEQDLDTAVRFHQQRTVDNLIELRT